MELSLEQALTEVWRQTLIDNAKFVQLGTLSRSPDASKKGLRQVDFVFEGNAIRGLEQNPGTKSRWAQLVRSGKKSDAVSSEWSVRGKYCGWGNHGLREAGLSLQV
jgi:hypothetical protein